MQPECTLLYVHAERIGYARAGQSIANELVKRHVRLYDDIGYALPQKGYEAPSSPTNVLSMVSVPSHLRGWYQDQFLSILTMYETRRLPSTFRQAFHEYDLIMVPSWQNVELFSPYHDNVQFISLGVDPEIWHPTPVVMPMTHFRFMIAGRGQRKGVDLAYEAFRTVFPQPEAFTPIPQLIMKSNGGHGAYYHRNVTHITGVLDPQAEVDLYASAHCYLQPSRGEGFGLQPLQALSLGRPTILTAAHGHESFAHLGVGISAVPSTAEYFIWGDSGEWWEPNFEELCEAMWDVYSHYDTHLAAAQLSAEYIAHHLTWANTTDRFIELHGDQLTTPYSGDGSWKEPINKLYPVSVVREWNGEIAGRSVQMLPGEMYYEDADIKRILYDAQVLSAECLDDDEGLLPQQVAELPDYKERHSYCPTCHQRYNSGIKRSDVIFEELENAREDMSHWYPLSVPTIGGAEIGAATEVLASGDTTMGALVEKFEGRFAEAVQARHAVMVNSGSSANLLLAQVLAVSDRRNEVLVPAVTWPTQVWPWIQAGFTVRLVDVDPLSLNASADDYAAGITPQTRVLSLVHLMGNPCDMDPILTLAHEHGLVVTEDCCEAFGARYHSIPVGSFGEGATWSFFFSHHLTTMEGGMVTTGRADLADRLRSLRSHGWNRHNPTEGLDPKYTFTEPGYNVRPTEVNAAIGLVQLRRWPSIRAAREGNWTRFTDQILGLGLHLPRVPFGGEASWFGFPLVVTPKARFSRDRLANHLEVNGVETRPILAGNLARQPIGKHFAHGELPGADEIHNRGLFIGLHPRPDDMNRLVDLIQACR